MCGIGEGALGESHARLAGLTMMMLLGAIYLPEGVVVLLPFLYLGGLQGENLAPMLPDRQQRHL